MELDARALPAGTTLEADVCVVGAGPAGISLARALAAEGVEVVLLESGGLALDPAAQDLNAGGVSGPYAGPRATRHRQVGGTPHLWNTAAEGRGGWARHLPLDPEDFAVGTAEGSSATVVATSWPRPDAWKYAAIAIRKQTAAGK